MEIISRYRPIEHSLEKLRRKFHAAGGDPSAICESLVESLAEHYELDGATVTAMWIPRFVARVQAGATYFYFKIVDQDPADTHRYMDFLAKSGFGTAEVVPTSLGQRSIKFAGYSAYLMCEVHGERLSIKSKSDASKAGEILGTLHKRSEGFDIRARRSIETLILDFASFPDLPVSVVHGDYRLVHLYDVGSRLTILDCDEVCRMERIYDVFMFCACPDREIDRNPTFDRQMAFVDAYMSSIDPSKMECDMVPELLKISNEWREKTVGEWKKRGMEVPGALEELVAISLEQAREYASRMHTRSLHG
jgi:Ser/Thr protein kinase RdoA (MazF antagonist)